MNYTIFDFIGNIGVFLIILSYLLLQINKLNSNDILYSFMNLIGAALVIISLYVDFNISAFIIEVFWVLISLVGIVKYFKKHTLEKKLNI